MKFRKKPVVIDAIKFEYTEEGIAKLKEFCGTALKKYSKERRIDAKAEAEICTLEDGDGKAKHIATEGDWIIKGVNGEFYPCKPDIFKKTYEKIQE